MDERLAKISDPSNIVPAEGCQNLYFNLFNSMYDGIGLFEFTGGKLKALYLNERYFHTLGYTKEQYLPYLDNVTVTLFEDDETRLIENVRRMCGSCCEFSGSVRGYKGDNSVAWFCVRGRFVDFIGSENPVLLASVYDCTRSKELEHNLNLNKERYRILEETGPRYLFEYDPENDQMTFSPARDREEKRIDSYGEYLRNTSQVNGADAAYFYCILLGACRSVCRGSVDLRSLNESKDGYVLCRLTYSSVADEYESIIRVLGRIELMNNEADLSPVLINRTGNSCGEIDFLPDPSRCIARIEEHLKKQPKNVYMVLIDIDGLDAINSLCGYEEGTDMLRRFAQLMQETFPEGFVFRYTPDIFAVYAENLTEKNMYYLLDGMKQAAGVFFSAGAAHQTSVTESTDIRDFLITAARALYRAKTEGGSRVHSELIVSRE